MKRDLALKSGKKMRVKGYFNRIRDMIEVMEEMGMVGTRAYKKVIGNINNKD